MLTECDNHQKRFCEPLTKLAIEKDCLKQHIESTKQKQDTSLVNITKRCELRVSYTSTFDIPS